MENVNGLASFEIIVEMIWSKQNLVVPRIFLKSLTK